MKILSLNLNREKENQVTSILQKITVDIYAFQECKLNRGNAHFNTINFDCKEGVMEKNGEKFEQIWEEAFPWIEFPQNYFAENEIENNGNTFVLINVHLAGFKSGLRHLLMYVLLERLKKEDLQSKTVILLGDFNGNSLRENECATALQKRISRFLDQLMKIGFDELKSEAEKIGNDEITYRDNNGIGYKVDHVYIKGENGTMPDTIKIVSYCPASINDDWYSDHRGIILEI